MEGFTKQLGEGVRNRHGRMEDGRWEMRAVNNLRSGKVYASPWTGLQEA